MEVTKLVKKDLKYECYIDDEPYIFDEEIILKYRLFAGKKLDRLLLDEINEANEIQKYYNKALAYQVKYAKSSREVINYLIDKGLSADVAYRIINSLVSKRLIDDERLAIGLAASMARNSNGYNMIRYKLKNKLFNDEIISIAINNLDEEDINIGKDKLLKKLEKQYSKHSDVIKSKKIKESLYRHGY